MRFADRAAAGRLLGIRLSARQSDNPVVVLGLPRGGVAVAYEVARVLKAPLDLVVVRKVGVPSQSELAMGALAEGGIAIREEGVCEALHVSKEEYAHAASNEMIELERRVRRYRRGQSALELGGRTAILVDDGIATGATARAGVASVRARGASRVVLAVPVASVRATKELARVVDDLVVLANVRGQFSVGSFYERFDQTSDREVMGYLSRSQRVATNPARFAESERSDARHMHVQRSP